MTITYREINDIYDNMVYENSVILYNKAIKLCNTREDKQKLQNIGNRLKKGKITQEDIESLNKIISDLGANTEK